MIKDVYSPDALFQETPLVKNVQTYMKLGIVESEQKGVVVRKSQFVECNIAEQNKHFKSSDFDLANIISVGAFNTLQPVVITPMSDFAIADKFEGITLSIPTNPE